MSSVPRTVPTAFAIVLGLAYWRRRRPAPSPLSHATLRAAWEQQDSALMLTLFTTDAVYHELVPQEPIRGHEGIAAYGEKKS
ncbi:MAG: nuclear transport factor 2 family protein [Candidatus Tectomicrobia bacterium]|nr:nuclear transport factor 2 family protein [Candidatus Tectomicrobia bacterium]